MESKNYVLIGGSYGIGSSMAEKLISAGNSVYVLSRTRPSVNGIHHIPFDVEQQAVSTADLPSAIHGLAYLPGTIQLKPFHRFTDEEFMADFKLNTLLAAKTIRDLLMLLKAGGQSSVVLFSTVAVQQGMPFHASVAMAKGALEGLTRSLAAELAPKIRVNAIAPSITDTPLASRILSSEEKKKASGERHPLKRVGEVGDIAEAAVYLLSEKSSWVSGQILHVDGGMSALRI
ncbi:MAG: SDR family oxidoreductase [Cyclobacteriaceae bacterium]|jgi:NAD(P)-dependent dehydrogenase (short-subunit alcohol dehydrogenase family)|nr:SDR family oxidoreductase [Cyclobacteriaceae bacterium]